ncbi:SDR family NAD(P)-dependent oxidoreductase [Sorangium sp. So ce362]|uniref:SDR family NAD(P)-dependent oxidoreductase n=1 Tax=Sorangium sp. So ce362 TaxID=3133303 RepID=UPI003F5DD259
MSLLLEGKRVVVTGASRGLGRAIALACAREGAAGVGIGYRERASEAADVAAAVEAARGGRALALGFDVADEAAVAAAVARFEAEVGPIDGWVNGAGVVAPGLLVTGDVAQIRAQIETNLLGPLLCARAVLPRMMRRKRGVVLNVSSVAAVRPARGQAAYAAAKGGIEALTRALAVEYARKGIRVVCLRPGPVDTDMLGGTRALAGEEIVARVPQQRIAAPGEIADYAAFLLSDRAAYVTGAVASVDGGYAVG